MENYYSTISLHLRFEDRKAPYVVAWLWIISTEEMLDYFNCSLKFMIHTHLHLKYKSQFTASAFPLLAEDL